MGSQAIVSSSCTSPPRCRLGVGLVGRGWREVADTALRFIKRFV
jgi:hypothetical protein